MHQRAPEAAVRGGACCRVAHASKRDDPAGTTRKDAHDMEWPEIQKRLLGAAAMLKEHKAVDIGIKSSLALIPFVGGFVSEYWDRLDVHGEAQASELADVLTKLAAQEDLFQRVAERLESQGRQLLEVKLSISQIVNDI